MLPRGPEAVSPTAHYTGAVWARHGLSHPALATLEGRVLLEAVKPLLRTSRLLGGPTLEDFLLARHRVIDHLLWEAIEAGRVGQVVEVAAGLSPRGWRLTVMDGADVDYVEADLPGMAARKRKALHRAGAGHRVVELDAFAASGGRSLGALAAQLDPDRGVAVVNEGLLNYFPRGDVEGFWARLVDVLGGFPHLLYLSDLHVRSAVPAIRTKVFTTLLGAFVRGEVHLHYADEAEAEAALRAAGFAAAELHPPRAFDLPGCDRAGAQLVRVIEATA